LGLPAEESDIFEKLFLNNIVSAKVKDSLKLMKGFRILSPSLCHPE
jgi:uncharacterized protein YutE (UPF0331/DUF86 family)